MVKVNQTDVTNERGLRNLIDCEAELLAGSEFNIGENWGLPYLLLLLDLLIVFGVILRWYI